MIYNLLSVSVRLVFAMLNPLHRHLGNRLKEQRHGRIGLLIFELITRTSRLDLSNNSRFSLEEIFIRRTFNVLGVEVHDLLFLEALLICVY